MSEPAGAPPPAKPPEFIQWIHWGADYLAREGKVIWQAKATFGVAASVLIALSVWLTWKAAGALFEERIASKDATIATKDANIKYLEAQIGPREKSDPPKVIAADEGARFDITYQYNRSPEKLTVNVISVNRGAAPSTQLYHVHAALYTKKTLSKADLDSMFAILLDTARRNRATANLANQIYPNQPPVFWTIFDFSDDDLRPVILDEAKMKTIIEGDMRLYVFVLLQYRDRNTPEKKWRSTEACTFLFQPGSTGICDSHNTTGLID